MDNNKSKIYQNKEINTPQIVRWIAASILITDLAIISRHWPAAITMPVILPAIILIPGFLISLLINLKTKSKIELALYASGLGISFWIIGGLIINWTLPLAGIERPLDHLAVLLFFNGTSALLLWMIKKKNLSFNYRKTEKISRVELGLIATPPVFVFMSLLGSEILNRSNESGGIVIAAMLVLAAAYVVRLISTKSPIREEIYVWGIWCTALALLLMYSMRSYHLMGWDVNLEYQVFQTTWENGYWVSNQAGNREYNTCLSITILPAMLAHLLPIPSEYLYKLVFQMIFAISPVIIYALGRRYFSKNKSFLASFLFMSQTWFYEQMPALIRQEIALIFFALALLAIFDNYISRKKQVALFLLFSASMIISHYSTSYIWAIIFFFELIIFSIVRIIFPSLREMPRRLTFKLFAISLAFLFFWNGIATTAGNSVANFARELPNRTSEALSLETLKTSLLRVAFNAPPLNTEENLYKKYNDLTASSRSQYMDLYDESAYQGYVPEIIYIEKVWKPLMPEYISRPVLIVSRIAKILAVIIFTLIGVGYMFAAFRRNRTKNISEFVSLGIATLPLIIAIIFLPLFNISYNISRLFMQTYIILSIIAVIGGIAAFKFLSKKKAPLTYLAIIFCAFFLYSTGFTERIFGGAVRITLDTQENAYEPSYISESEAASAKWLDENNKSSSPVYADPLGSLRVHAFTSFNENMRYEIFPSYISKDGYVYMSNMNTKYEVAYTSFSHNLIGYNQPTQFLEENKNLVYNNGKSKIYR